MGDEDKGYQCRRCKWQGLKEERNWLRAAGSTTCNAVCPDCGHDTFRGLLNYP